MIHNLKEYCYRKFRTSFSKSGEDIMLYQLLKNSTRGCYIDIGAHDPKIHSNSYFFYLRGWKGICVEPNPEYLSIWKSTRPKDVFLNCGVSMNNSVIDYYCFKDSVRNTFSKNYIEEFNLEEYVQKVIKIETRPLNIILDEHNMENKHIGFISIDAEGLDHDVIRSNDWNKYRPEFILIESFCSLKKDFECDSLSYLDKFDYHLIGKIVQYDDGISTIGSLVFKRG